MATWAVFASDDEHRDEEADDQAAAEAFYRVVDAAYERRSLAVTSNLHPSGFDTIMAKTLATDRGGPLPRPRRPHRRHLATPLRCRRRTRSGALDLTPQGEQLSADREINCPPGGKSRCPLTPCRGAKVQTPGEWSWLLGLPCLLNLRRPLRAAALWASRFLTPLGAGRPRVSETARNAARSACS